ncbi:MAG: hypothetical protein U5M53_04725 [Rhodoferax sp.]|nr:hypothetical protein [Rhodoferax sp.]
MLAFAIFLIVATGAAHSYLGERYLLMRLFKRQDLPKLLGGTAFTVGTLRFAWHLTTVAWWGLAYMVYAARSGPVAQDDVLTVVGMTTLVSAAFPLYFTRGKHLSWVVFLVVGAVLLGARSG